jgi:hypothetical protein
MNLPNKQQGMSASGWIFLILIIGGMTTIGMKLIPFYMDFGTVKTVLNDMSQEPGLVNKRLSVIEGMIVKKLKLNNIRDFGVKDRITLKRASDRVVIDVMYNEKIPVVANIQLLVSFDHRVELRD